MADEADKLTRQPRRDFLSGKLLRDQISQTGEKLADELYSENAGLVQSVQTVRLATKAMNCEFAVILNAVGDRRAVLTASDTLEQVHEIESRLTVYRETSELLELNTLASHQPLQPAGDLFQLLQSALDIARQTEAAFHPVALPLNRLWRSCRKKNRLPSQEELQQALDLCDLYEMIFDQTAGTIQFLKPGMGFDLGGMGKGYALDVLAKTLNEQQVENYLLHGGHSSILARGDHLQYGWPIGIRHPQQPQKRLATVVLKDQAFSASGSGVQYFRIDGKRYGHLFDPRTGWPVDHLASVIVIATEAATADALSTAFSVTTIEQTTAYCEQHPEVAAILIPPANSLQVKPILLNCDSLPIYWEK